MALLELEPPGPTLVAAHTQLATAHFLTGSTRRRLPPPTVRCALAETLGLPEPARAIGARGNSRAYLGDPDGLAEMERALPMLIEQGAGNQAATPPEQPRHRPLPAPGARPLARRLRAGDRLLRAARPNRSGGDDGGRLPGPARRARPPGGGARASRCARCCRRGERRKWCSCGLRALELATHLARGEAEGASGIADWLVEAARTQATSDATVEVLAAAAAARLAAGAPDQARALLAEIEQTPGARDVPYYSRQLGAMLRTALAAGDPDLAERLADGLEPRYPGREHALCAARAQLAEHAGDHADAAVLYAEAAARWQQFGNVREYAYALLGQGRCLVAREDPAAEQPLRDARRSVQLDGLPPRSRRDGSAPRANERAALLEQAERSRAPTQPPYNGIKPVRPRNRPYGSVAVPLELARARSLHVR